MNARPAVIFLCLSVIALASGTAVGHPMGNFSISHHTTLRPESDGLHVRFRIDMAEIPTFQQMSAIDANRDNTISPEEAQAFAAARATEFSRQLALTIDSLATPLTVLASDGQVRAGAGELATLLVTIDYIAAWTTRPSTGAVELVDNNFAGRAGWREMLAVPGRGCRIDNSTAAANDRSQGLTAYPLDALAAPPQQSSARFRFTFDGTTPTTWPTTAPASTSIDSGRPTDRLAELIARKDWSMGAVALSLAIAFVLGSLHALAPGHGKTVVAAYLVGSRGTPWHAFLLGAIVTLTHTVGVFALGLVVLFASRYVLPADLYPWLGFFSGMMIFAIGGWQLVRRVSLSRSSNALAIGHVHGPGGHSHALPDRITPGALIALGVSGGMVPCPSALVLLLSAVALHRVGLGLLLIVAFSLGLAIVLIVIGLLMLYARRAIESLNWQSKMTRHLPIASSLIVTLLGFGIAVQSLTSGGIVKLPW